MADRCRLGRQTDIRVIRTGVGEAQGQIVARRRRDCIFGRSSKSALAHKSDPKYWRHLFSHEHLNLDNDTHETFFYYSFFKRSDEVFH